MLLQQNSEAAMRHKNPFIMVYYALQVGAVWSTFSFSQKVSWTIFLSQEIQKKKIGLVSVHHDFNPEIDLCSFHTESLTSTDQMH